MRQTKHLALLAARPLALAISVVAQQPSLEWQLQDSGVEVSLRGLSAVSERVAWASGSNGTWLRTIDGGASWHHGRIPGAEELGVRDIHAFDELDAVALTIVSPGRVYRTHDGGYTWEMVFEDARAEVFFNCMDFADDQRGYAVGDPIDGRFLLIETLDGGKHWAPLSAPSRPQPEDGEAQFAASGTCLQATGNNIWIGTGGNVARVSHSADRGRSWKVSRTPLQQGSPSQGVFGLFFWTDRDGIIGGGDYNRETDSSGNFALTDDAGSAWDTDWSDRPTGFRSAVVTWLVGEWRHFVAVGPSGSDLSESEGKFWEPIEGPGFHVISIATDGTIWAAGADGRIARLIQH
jgi:photosystem II stability/assembly factor-like uncharacterized protein